MSSVRFEKKALKIERFKFLVVVKKLKEMLLKAQRIFAKNSAALEVLGNNNRSFVSINI